MPREVWNLNEDMANLGGNVLNLKGVRSPDGEVWNLDEEVRNVNEDVCNLGEEARNLDGDVRNLGVDVVRVPVDRQNPGAVVDGHATGSNGE